MSKKVLIIGAGIGGVATASLLAQAGFDVHVYESADTFGGRAGQLKRDGFTFDTGPSWYLMPTVFERFYQHFGESIDSHLSLVKLTPAYKVFFEQQPPITITGNISTDAATFESIEPGAGSALQRYVRQSDKIYQLSLRHFLYNAFRRPADLLQWEVVQNSAQLARLLLSTIHTHVARFVHDQRLQQILEYPMVFLGSSPFNAPALYSLMSALDFKEGVYYPIGGIYTLMQSMHALAVKQGVTFHFSMPVTAIQVAGKEATGVTLADGSTHPADVIISNADVHFTETKLLPVTHRSYSKKYWRNKQASPSALLLYLGVQGSIPEFEHHTLLFVNAWRQNFDAIYTSKNYPKSASLYICTPSRTDSSTAPRGFENVFVLVPLPAGKVPSPDEQEQLVAHYLKQILAMTGVDLASRLKTKTVFGPSDFATKYHSWQASMLGQSHKLTQSAFFRTPNRSKKVTNLWYVGGNTRPGVGLPMCVIGAELVAKDVCRYHNRGAHT